MASDNRLKWSVRWVLALLLAGVVLGGVGRELVAPQTARAQIPNSGAQRNEIVQELRALNARLGSIEALLKSGKIKVIAETPEAKHK